MSIAEPATERLDHEATEVGSVFVSNYPPYSFWVESLVPRAHEALAGTPEGDVSLGLYLHIPFCRKRCKFCYFRVLTDKNSQQIRQYIDAGSAEVELYSQQPALQGRNLRFIYFGGGTPSYISADQLRELVSNIKRSFSWDSAEEVAFECEPGTLTRTKLEAIKEVGVTRLSLGIESFDDEILRENGRAHVSNEIYRVRPWIEEIGFEQLNIDLIAGMVGETEQSWRDSIRKAIDYDPDSVTIYQMELPFNTVYSKDVLGGSTELRFASWSEKRAWHGWAIEELEAAGFERWSAYVMLKRRSERPTNFVYADSLWHGADMIGVGVSSFSHVGSVHFQNADRWDDYLRLVGDGELPIHRAFVTNEDERRTRELILQLKTGRVSLDYFRDKFHVDLRETYEPALEALRGQGMLEIDESEIRVSPEGVLRVDQLLPEFYDEKYRSARYT